MLWLASIVGDGWVLEALYQVGRPIDKPPVSKAVSVKNRGQEQSDSLENRPRLGLGSYLPLVPVFPFFGYALAFCFEWGYLSYFGVPRDVIRVDLSRFLLFTTWGSVGFVLVVGVILVVRGVVGQMLHHRPMLARSVVVILLVGIFVLFQIWVKGGGWEMYVASAAVWVFIICLELLFPILTQRKESGYERKLTAQQELEDKPVTALGEGFLKRTGLPLRVVLSSAVFVLFVTYWVGMARARTQDEFYTLNNGADQVVLRVYGDVVLAVPFSRMNSSVEAKLTLIRPDSPAGLELTREEVGPLRRRE